MDQRQEQEHTAQARALRDALRRLMVAHGALDEAARPCGEPLSAPHAHALLELRASPVPLSVAALAATLRIDRSNVSRLCAKMEALGQLERATDPDDARARALKLTALGHEVAARVDRASARHFGALAEGLGESLGQVVEALARLQEVMAMTPAPDADDDEVRR